MSDPPPSRRSPPGRDLTPEQRYWQLWRGGHRPDLATFLAALGDPTPAEAAAVIGIDQYERWTTGERTAAEAYLALLPEGEQREQAECDVVYGEYLLREQLGESPALAEYQGRFPALAEALARQVSLHHALNERPPSEPAATQPQAPEPEEPPVIPGYEIYEQIGRGGMGVVYRARQLSLGRDVALKVLRVWTGQDATALERMRREAKVTGRLSHPNIVTVHDAALAGQWFYIAMEYVAGVDLHRMVERSGPLPVPRACSYLWQAALGLQCAFEQGLVHRDIKPSNLIVAIPPDSSSQTGTLKLLDLGLARSAPTGSPDEVVTQIGTFMGTPDFIAPEQANDPRAADVRSDLYSLGCTFYYVLTGVAPFAGATPLAKLMQHHLNAPPPLDEKVPAGLAAIIHKLMAKQPADRYQTPAELLEALDAFQRGTAPAPPPARPAPAKEPPRAALLRRLTGPADWVKCVAFSPDGAVLAAGSLDRSLRLWDAAGGRELGRVEAHVGGVLCLAFAPDGRLVTGGQDRALCLWDVADPARPRQVWRAEGHADNVNAVCFLPGGERLLSASHDGTLRLWDREGRELVVWGGHSGPVWGVAAADGRVISGGQDRTLSWWDSERGTPMAWWPDQPAVVSCVALSPDGKLALTGGSDGALRLFDASGRVVESIPAHQSRVTAVAFSPGGRHILSGSRDQTARVVDLSGKALAALQGHTWWVTSVAWSPDGSLAATGGGDRTVCVWRLSGM